MIRKNYAVKIVFVYLLFGILWIFLSDTFISTLNLSVSTVMFLSVIKGWIYVGLSAGLIYVLVRFYLQEIAAANQSLQASYSELETAKESLRENFEELQQSYEQINRQHRILAAVQETTVDLLNQLDQDLLLDKILEAATSLGKTEHGLLTLLNPVSQRFELRSGRGMFSGQAGVVRIEQNAGQLGEVLHSGKASIVQDYSAWEHRLADPLLDQVQSAIHVPMKINQQIVGTMGIIYTDEGHTIGGEEEDLLERFAALAAIALNNARLHTQLQQDLREQQEKEETIHAIFNAANDAIFVYDADSLGLISCNRKAEELLGFSLGDMQQMGTKKIDETCFGGQLCQSLAAMEEDRPLVCDFLAVNQQGQALYLEASQNKSRIGESVCIVVAIRDVSERRRVAAELERVREHKLALLKSIPDLLIWFDGQGNFIDYNKPPNFDLYIPAEEFIGKNIRDFFSTEISQRVLAYVQQSIEDGEGKNVLQLDYQLVENKEVREFEARFVKCSVEEVMAIIRDVTYQKRMIQQLQHLCMYDSLTQAYNRTYFEEKAMSIGSKGAGIIVCDVDGLKLINDTIGHKAGDDLLKTVARILQECAIPPDIAARIGGDEFAILVFEPNQTKMADLAEKIKNRVTAYNNEHVQLPLSLSIGWAADENNVVDMDALFKEADNNMYRVKMHQSRSSHSSIVGAMMQALEARDYITEGHADRLQHLVQALAHKLGLSDPMIADLNLFAKFHDIGKVGIPDHILFKPDKLTEEEFCTMKRHSEIGFRIAKSAPDLLPIADWILKHHERWAGNGYPLGIRGEKIPLACRILALADSFDAMTNDRPYHTAMTKDAAVAEIRRGAGGQFDPALTEMFIEMIAELDRGLPTGEAGDV